MAMKCLFYEDFRGFRIGDFPYETYLGAMGEYHYRPPQWYAGRWYNPIPGISRTWLVTECDGQKLMEYSADQASRELRMLVTGDEDWTDYEVSVDLRMLLTSGCAGLLFRYRNSRCYYSLCLRNGSLELAKRNHAVSSVIASCECTYTSDEFHSLKVVCNGSRILCYADSSLCLEADDSTYESGKIAIAATTPVQFSSVSVLMEAAAYQRICSERHAKAQILAAERAKYPSPLLWRTIDLGDYGAGRHVRFGHLKGNGEMQMVIAQNQRRIAKDAFAQISCLTAMDLEGNILWQIGEPSPQNAHLTADLPFQVHDIDGDGKDEVIVARDLKLMILDGETGEIRRWAHTPLLKDSPKDLNIGWLKYDTHPFDRLNVDSIRICNLSGGDRPNDLLIKDRYKRVWALDQHLNVLWQHVARVNTGHFPYSKDIDGDGREEVMVGYDLLDADGRLIWSLPIHSDHADEIIIGKIDPERDEMVAIAAGDEGFILADLQGNIIRREFIGHAQRISVGNYRPELPGLEICVTTYWGNQGIILLYDCKGRLLWSAEPSTNGNIIAPVNWTGDGQDLILLNGNVARGGMIDGHNRQVVPFPDDGHPDMCAEVVDLTGDCRDEIVLWDEKRMYIYTQSNEFEGDMVACPEKYPHYNGSNYRGEYSYPRVISTR